jgi:hypothetical protein
MPIGKKIWEEEIKPQQQALNEALLESGYEYQNKTPNKTVMEKLQLLGIDETPDVFVVNVRSNPQVVALLNALGYSTKTSKGEDKDSADEETLKGLIESEGSVVAKTVLKLRSNYALLGVISKSEDSDRKFRTTLKLYVTETTRLSSTKSHFGTGMNMQNVTKSARPLFCGGFEDETKTAPN